YLSMLEVLESIDLMAKNAPYRKFRPDLPVHKNTKFWWRYAFNSIMEVHIRRSNHMWSWSKIKQHRKNLRVYKTAYKTKLLSQNKLGPDTEKQIQVIRSGQKLAGKKAGGQKQGGGFFSGWFGRKAKKEEQEVEESKEPESLDQLMTAEEKEKLYTAIGYSGSSHNLALPKQYVAVIITFQLLRTSVTIREQHDVPETLNIQMVNLSTKISQRPGAQAVRVEAALEHWYVTGLQQQGTVPSLIASVGDSSSSLLTVVFELNPEESAADQLLKIHSQPVEIIYDAVTINSMVDFFKMGKGVDLEVLTSATLSKLEEIKEKTSAGLSHVIETRKVLDLKIDLKPSYLLIPKSGFYSSTSDLMIVDFGETWKTARLQSSSVQHILQPMDLTLHLAKCMVEKDARMPRFKLSGELPLMHFRISDQKIQNIMELVESIPMPKMDSAPSTPTEKVLLELTRQVDQEKTILSFNILQLGAEGKMRSYDMGITSYLRQVSVDYCDVEVSSLDFLLHTKALLATISYLNSTVPAQFSATRDQETKKQVQKTEQGWTGSYCYCHIYETETNLNAPYMQRRPHQLCVTQSSCRLTPPFVFQMFFDNFQTAKEALSSATSQAAEKAASSVRDFAQKSFRLSMDIRLKAPLIIIPQSSTSQNALVVDLGLITVENSFALRSGEGFPVPVVVEKMDIKLTQLKLCRYLHYLKEMKGCH
ncbi:hypothetical protein GOODEAATRI_003487, partial [Goodea atripinnis]